MYVSIAENAENSVQYLRERSMEAFFVRFLFIFNKKIAHSWDSKFNKHINDSLLSCLLERGKAYPMALLEKCMNL